MKPGGISDFDAVNLVQLLDIVLLCVSLCGLILVYAFG